MRPWVRAVRPAHYARGEVAMSASKNVVVVGAGIGGLTAALALLKRGIDVDVYEQSNQLKEVGAGIQISSNGTRVLFALGLELVRSRRQKHGAVRHAASHAAPRRSAWPSGRRGSRAQARRHHAEQAMRLGRLPCGTRRSNVRARQYRKRALRDRRRWHPF